MYQYESWDDREKRILGLVKAGKLRMVLSSKRKRKLQRKGVPIWWERTVGAFIWEADHGTDVSAV